MTSWTMTMAANDSRHGTVNGYCNQACRCPECREAWASYVRSRKKARKQVELAADDPRHGSRWTYSNWGCRCLSCTDDWRAYGRELRAAKKDQ
jgi:hypothetical protein